MRSEAVTYGEVLRELGREAGRAEARAEARASWLLLQIQRRFGPVSARVRERVHAASDAEHERWLAGILTADALNELLPESEEGPPSPAARRGRPVDFDSLRASFSGTLVERLENMFRELGPKGEQAFLLGVNTLIEEGHAQGRAEERWRGRADGRASSLLLQIERKFGAVADEVRTRVHAGTDAEHERWLERILSARTLGELFETAP